MTRSLAHLAFVTLVLWSLMSLYAAARLAWEYFHGARTFAEITVMIPVMSLAFMVILATIVLPSFAATQALQGAALFWFARSRSARNVCLLPLSVALLALLSFECFDYLVPSYRFMLDPDPM